MSIYVITRRIISVAVLAFITLGLYGFGADIFLALSKMQFGPTLGRGFGFILALLATIIFGRIYCSTICPLGTAQDIAAGANFKRKYKYHKPNIIRYVVLAIVVIAVISGFGTLLGVADPYAIYVRAFSGALPHIFLIFLILAAAVFRGRFFCNTICPVGAILGCASKFSAISPRINEKCVSCGKCEKVCKCECIDLKNKTIDSSRCVMCGNCAKVCGVGAIDLISSQSEHRRGFFKSLSAAAFFGALPFVPKIFLPKSAPAGKSPSIPAGTLSWARFTNHCIGCGACIKRCPSKVLEHSYKFGIKGFMKPMFNFDKGFCQYECVECGYVCPANAILPLTPVEKSKVQTGTAQCSHQKCIIITKGENCAACAEHCPTGAIMMVSKNVNQKKRPVVKKELCVGCGACEYACPVFPEKAIVVTPLAIHQAAQLIEASPETQNTEEEGFKF